MKALREKIAAGDAAALDETLKEAAGRRVTWLVDFARGDWETPENPPSELPKSGDTLRRFLVGGLFDRKKN